jgi:hypothetical protein
MVPTQQPTPSYNAICVKASVPLDVPYKDLTTVAATQLLIRAVAECTNSLSSAVAVDKFDRLCDTEGRSHGRLNDHGEEPGESMVSSEVPFDASLPEGRRLQSTSASGNLTFSIVKILAGKLVATLAYILAH